MTKYIIAIIIIFSFQFKGFSQTSDSTVNALLAMNETDYINKPLDSIIAHLPPGYIRIKVHASTHYYTVRCLNILYPNEVWIDLHVREFTHINPRNDNRDWNISLLRKEKLYKTVIYKHIVCYRNCDVY